MNTIIDLMIPSLQGKSTEEGTYDKGRLFYNGKWNNAVEANLNLSVSRFDLVEIKNKQYYILKEDLKNWDRLFEGTNFNQDISNWVIPYNITSMEGMFSNCPLFNQPLNNWNVSNVKNFANMFNGAIAFNQPLDNWKMFREDYFVPNKTPTQYNMFNFASSFNQNISNWIMNDTFFTGCPIQDEYKPTTIIEGFGGGIEGKTQTYNILPNYPEYNITLYRKILTNSKQFSANKTFKAQIYDNATGNLIKSITVKPGEYFDTKGYVYNTVVFFYNDISFATTLHFYKYTR